MAAGEIPTIPTDLMIQVQDLARQQGRPAADLIAEAVKKYLDDRRWNDMLSSARRRASAMGLTEDDVPRLIAEDRAEQASGR
jgi:metal-responsive CopG/Arc/MetJ family transcriptional regulator